MESLTRRALAKLAVLGGAAAVSAATGVAAVPDSLDAFSTHFGTRVFTYDVVNEAVVESTGGKSSPLAE